MSRRSEFKRGTKLVMVHRGGDGVDETPHTSNSEEYDRREWELGEYGFPNDGYDYSQHFRPMGGSSSAVFVAPDGSVAQSIPLISQMAMQSPEQGGKEGEKEGVDDAHANQTKEKKVGEFVCQEDADFEDQKGKYRSVNGGDKEVDGILLEERDGEVEEVEEMPDDFVRQMMEGGSEGEEGEVEEEREERRGEGEMEERFDEVLKGYEDEEIGDLSGNEECTKGTMTMEQLLKYIAEHDSDDEGGHEEDDDEPTREEKRREKQRKLLEEVQREGTSEEQKAKTLELVRRQLSRKGQKKDVVVVASSAARDSHWDCESHVSSFSTVSNVPSVIMDDEDEPPSVPRGGVRVSRKTGMPLSSVLKEAAEKEEEEEEEEEEEGERVNEGAKRPEDMTPQERRERKKAIKEVRRSKRTQKKELKVAYKTAEVTQSRIAQAQAPTAANQTVFHLSQL